MSDRPPPPRIQTSFRLTFWAVVTLCVVIFIALIGIFAIEELEARDETLRLVIAHQAELANEISLLGDGADGERDALLAEQTKLRELQQRITSLIVSGAVRSASGALAGKLGTLDEIQCELLQLRNSAIDCVAQERGHASWWPGLATIFLKDMSERSASGAVFAVLVITAALGGALVSLSVTWTQAKTMAQVPYILSRAVGGGIVCYLAIDGGSLPMTALDLLRYDSPATASLLGFLAGMFSENVFILLSKLVDAFIARITPDEDKARDKPTDGSGDDANGAAGKPTADQDPPRVVA